MKANPEPAERVLVLTRLLEAPRALVFKVWTQPEHLTQWWGPNDFTLPHCEVDFREGGKYKFCMRAPDGSDHWVWGNYEVIDEPERLVFSWHRTPTPETVDPWAVTKVTIFLTEHQGKTKLVLHQAVFSKSEECADHQGGWTECLNRLVQYAHHLR